MGVKKLLPIVVAALLVAALVFPAGVVAAPEALATRTLPASVASGANFDGKIPADGELLASSVIHSPYASTPPSIDGVLSPDEWGSPAISKTLTYFNAVDNQNETHNMTVYFMNNHSYLYAAMKITDDDFEHEDYPTGEDVDVIELYFDNDNDEVIEAYEDIKNFWNLRYRDWFKVGAQYRWNDDLNDGGTLDGEGVATHSDLALGDYTYEFKIPLNSGDTHDLSISAGSTIGIKIMYREMYWDTANGVWEWKGEDGWPTSSGRFDGSTYGKLILSSAGTETPSVITNDATNITTNSATLNGNLDNLGTASTVDVSFEWGADISYGNETTPEAIATTGPFSFNLSDLSSNTTYHFRAKAVGKGTSYGLDKSFGTVPAEGERTIVAARLQNTVTADGAISGNEWDDAGQLSLNFVYTHDKSSIAYSGTIYLKHDGAYLWICIVVEDDDENRYPEPYDYAAILFDANGDGEIGHHDDSAILHHGLGAFDLRPGEEEVWLFDTEFGGTNDVTGESAWSAGWYTFEMRKPLNSGDNNGYDIAISPGDTILSSSCFWDAGEDPGWSADAGSFYIELESFDPWDYDADEDGEISKAEALGAIVDYFDGEITKDQALEVIALYFA